MAWMGIVSRISCALSALSQALSSSREETKPQMISFSGRESMNALYASSSFLPQRLSMITGSMSLPAVASPRPWLP